MIFYLAYKADKSRKQDCVNGDMLHKQGGAEAEQKEQYTGEDRGLVRGFSFTLLTAA